MITVLKPTNTGMETVARIDEAENIIALCQAYGWNIVLVNEQGLVSTPHDQKWSDRPLYLYTAIDSIKIRTIDYKLATEAIITLMEFLKEQEASWFLIKDYTTAEYVQNIFLEKGYYAEIKMIEEASFRILVSK